MSTVKSNRRKEIQKKQELQAKFQLSMTQMNSKVSNWLALPDKKESIDEKSTSPEAANPFLDLPIIPQGATLSNMSDLSTVKDFVKGDGKKPSRIEKDKKVSTSQPMAALLNKIRDDQRRNTSTRQRDGQIPKSQTKHKKQTLSENSNKGNKSNTKAPSNGSISHVQDEDSDDEMTNKHKHRAVNKSSGLQFGKKKRPF